MAEPKVRFKRNDGSSYPEWEKKTIEQCSSLIKDGTHGTHDDVAVGHALLSAKDIYDGVVHVPLDARRISDKDYRSIFKSYSLEVGDVLLTIVGTIGRTAVVSNKCLDVAFQRSVAVVRPRNFMSSCFFKSVMDNNPFQKELDSKKSQGAQAGVYLGALAEISISVPCLEEQQKIADFLSSVDEVIAASVAEVANLQTQKKAVMKKIFSQQVRFKQPDGSDFPEWEEKKLGDVATVLMCKRVLKEQTQDKGDIPFFKIGTFGGIPDAYITRELFEELKSKYSYPKKGNILLSAAGTIGRAVVFNGEEAYYQDSNIVWLDHDETITDEFLCQFYSITSWTNLEGGTVKRLYNGILLDKDISIPCLEEQRLIADFLSDFDEAIAAAKQELELWKQLKKGLLQQMFV